MDIFEDTILKWYNKSKYIRLGSDISVTELMRPARITHLINRHRPKIEVTELGKLIPNFIGDGIHDQLQKYLKTENMIDPGSWLVERKITFVYDNVRISGRFDALYNSKYLYDIKSTSTYKYENQDFEEWEQQLNIYDFLLWKEGLNIEELKIALVSTDWSKAKIWKKDYPQSRIKIISINKWTREKQEDYIKTHLKVWRDSASLKDDDLPLCTQKERWANDAEYKLYKSPTSRRSYKTFPTQDRADSYLKACQNGNNKASWTDAFIRAESKNVWRRCDFCDVNAWCNQFRDKLEP